MLFSRYSANNYNSLINNRDFIADVSQKVSDLLDKSLNNTEINFIIKKIKQLDPAYVMRPNNASVEKIAKVIISKMPIAPDSAVDSREMIKGFLREELAEEPTQFLSTFTGERIGNSISEKRIKHKSVVLDSRYRIQTDGDITSFKWVYLNNYSVSDGTVNAIGDIKNIIKVRTFPIKIPYIPSADNGLNRISMDIAEFSPQGFIAHENRRFIFIYESQVGTSWITLRPDFCNDCYFNFDEPIAELSSLTISFASPIETITFDPDHTTYTITYGALVSTITTAIPHNLISGDKVYFTNFTTLTPVADNTLINEINSNEGHYITFVSNYIFTVPISSLGAGAVPASLRLNLFFGAKRIIVPLEFTYINA